MYPLFLSFISGLTISFISFKVLPLAFALTGLYLSTVFILLGIIFSSSTECKLKLNNFNIYNVSVKMSLLVILISFYFNVSGFLLSFCGGTALYATSHYITTPPNKGYIYIFLARLISSIGIILGIAISI